MHCRRFVDPGLSRREMLLRCSSGFGALAMAALLREPAFGSAARRVSGRPAGRSHAAAAASRGEGPLGHLPLHGRRPVAGRHVRPQAPARPRAWPADQGQDASHAVQQRGERPGMSLEVPPVRRERHPGQRPVPARRPLRRPTWRSSARWSRTSPSTPAPTTSCTPAAGSRAARATAPGSPMDWAANARTSPASWC